MAIEVGDDGRQQSQLQLTAKTGKGRSGKGAKGLWRPSAEVARRHVGEWCYLAKKEGEFRIQLSERGTLLFLSGDASGVLLPQEKRWLEADLQVQGEAAGTAKVRFSEKTETMMYSFCQVGAEFEEATPAYRIMSPQEAARVSAEDAIALSNKAARILEKGLASATAGSWDLARRDLKCVLQDLEAGKEHWEDGPSRSQLVASSKSLVVLRLRSLCAEALAGLAECSLKGANPPEGKAALAFAEEALNKDGTCLEALLQKGLALLELGRPSQAEEILKEGLQANGSAVLARSAAESQEVLDQLESLLPDEELLQKVQTLRETGNEHVRQGRYEAAAWCYEDCLKVLWGKDLIFPSEVAERAKRPCTGLWRQIRAAETAVLTNLSLCCLQGQPDWAASPDRAIQLCEIALTYEPEQVKAMRRMGHAFSALNRYEEAEAVLTSAVRQRPKDATLRQDLQRARSCADDVRRRAKEWEREAFRDLFERLPAGFATPKVVEAAEVISWPESHFPTPQKCLGAEEVEDYVAHLSESLRQEGEAAYMMELLHTIRHAVEMQFGHGSGKQLARIVPLVQALTRSLGVIKTHEPGKGQRCLASYLTGLTPEQPSHQTVGPLAVCEELAVEKPQLLEELKFHEMQKDVGWEVPWSSQTEHSWHCIPLVRQGMWAAGSLFPRSCEVLSRHGIRPFEAGLAKVPAGGTLRHEANTNYVLTVHLILELTLPGSYVAHVGEQCRSLDEGVLVFDPSYVHWIENTSKAEMLLFYCHFYHPQIGEVERYALLLLAQLMEMLQSSGVVRSTSLAPMENALSLGAE